MPAQQPAPDALTSAESPDTSWGTSPAPAASPSGGRASGSRSSEALLPRHTSHERIARVAAVILLAIVCVAVVWPSGREVAELKDTVGPAFLSSEGKDVVLNLVMLAPATFCAVAGWRDMTGESAYDRYLERYAREHAQCPHGHGGAHGSEHGSGHGPMSEREFWRARAKQAETEINASCC